MVDQKDPGNQDRGFLWVREAKAVSVQVVEQEKKEFKRGRVIL